MADLDGKKLKQVIDPTLAKACTHPLRGHIWVTLFERGILSPSDVADELGLEVEDVSYHFRKLHRQELARLVQVVRRRGFDEHIYEPMAPALRFDDADWMALPAGIRSTFSGEMLKQIIEELIEALKSGSFDARNRHLSRSWMLVDERGLEEAMQVAKTTLEHFEAIHKRCAGRLKTSSDTGIPVSIAMAVFQTAESIARREGRAKDAE